MGKKRKINSAAGDLVSASKFPLDIQIEQARIVKPKSKLIKKGADVEQDKKDIDEVFIVLF
jgi:hypothetical protein